MTESIELAKELHEKFAEDVSLVQLVTEVMVRISPLISYIIFRVNSHRKIERKKVTREQEGSEATK